MLGSDQSPNDKRCRCRHRNRNGEFSRKGFDDDYDDRFADNDYETGLILDPNGKMTWRQAS